MNGSTTDMIFVSLTRLRLRSVRFLPLFALYATRALAQARRAGGFQTGALLQDRKWTFWTLTLWDSEESMRAYMLGGAHRQSMPHLQHWCDEASIAHWLQPEATLPRWEEADRRMRASGRVSKVRFPSPQHAGLAYQPPRTERSVPILAVRARQGAR